MWCNTRSLKSCHLVCVFKPFFSFITIKRLTFSFRFSCSCFNWLFCIRSHSHYLDINGKYNQRMCFTRMFYPLESLNIWSILVSLSALHRLSDYWNDSSCLVFSNVDICGLFCMICMSLKSTLCNPTPVVFLHVLQTEYANSVHNVKPVSLPRQKGHDESALRATGDPCGPIRTAV